MSDLVPRAHADRAGAPRWLFWSLVVAVAVTTGVATQAAFANRVDPVPGFLLGAGLGALAMVGLPSLSIRLLARVLLLVSALGLVRFGLVVGSLATGGQGLLVWLVAAVFVLVLSDRVATESSAPLRTDRRPGAAPAEGSTTGAGSTLRSAALIAGAVVLVAVVLAPVLLPRMGRAVEPGDGATLRPGQDEASALQATDSLDMTNRPELTDQIVFTVDTDRATFWRGQTFDVWDGRRWTRSDPRFIPLAGPDTPQIGADDLGARGSDVVEQRFKMVVPFNDVVFAAPTAVEVQVDRPVRQRADGTLVSAPLGRGAAYTVTSRRIPLTAEQLRAVDGPIPEAVRQQYAQPPVTTDRVRAAATEITAGAASQYDKVLALERWMGSRVEYSLDAPLAPKDVDVVDHFLFDAEQGWCEQIASSLVVLARANGIPARLVTGYVPGDHDPVTGQFTVRERDAHAWAEVWFPEVGWVPFDPTADVPLAGSDRSEPTIAEWLMDHLVVIGLVVGALVLLVGPVRVLVSRARARRAARPVGWGATASAALDRLGARGADETATAYGGVLARRYRDPRLQEVGRLIDDATFAPAPPDPAACAGADAVLAELGSAPVPEQEPAPVGAG